jgi:transcriptional regulator GlxA family with amidase domain
MQAELDRAAEEARNVSELFAAYRRALADMSEAARKPAPARQDRALRAALVFVQQHYGERLRLDTAARVAGFTPKYFSTLFRKREKKTFERYVFELRLERAKQLLSGTDLNMARIAELSGFGSPQYLNRVFRRVVGSTPRGYRLDLKPHLRKKRRTAGATRN